MKHLIFFLLLFVVCELSAQPDSLTYDQFKIEFLEHQPTTLKMIRTDPAFAPACIMVGTFALNQVIIRTMMNNGNSDRITKPVAIVYITGMVVSLGICRIKLRRSL